MYVAFSGCLLRDLLKRSESRKRAGSLPRPSPCLPAAAVERPTLVGRMLAFALEASHDETNLELTETAAVFQRLALREEMRAAGKIVDFAGANPPTRPSVNRKNKE